MQESFHKTAIRHPALTAAALSALTAGAVAAILVTACGPSSGAIFLAALAGAAISSLAGALFGFLLRKQAVVVDAAAVRLTKLAADCGNGSESAGSAAARGGFDPIRFDQDVTAIMRAYRSLEREREQSHAALEQQIARQSEFYAKLSHELRSPLNAILGYASLAIEDAEAGQLDDLPPDLRKIRGAGQNLLGLIDNLLQLAEDRTGREAAARVPFLLNDVLAQVVREHGLAAAGVLLAVQEDAGRETVFGNSAKVARAVGSLVDDAVRSRRATLVTISTRNSSTHDASVEIVVDARNAPPQRGEPGETLTRHLADRLAAAVSGSLEVEQRGESDWRYVLRLPLDVERAPGRLAVRAIPLTHVPAAKPRPGRKSALVIDDDAATIDLMSRWLERSGYEVRAANDAEEGLAIAQAMEPDIVLLDALMPGRTGYDVLPDLTALPALRETPILIVTVDDDRSRGLAAGASDYVRKPITEARLREIISVYEKNLSGEVLIIDDDSDSADLLERTVRRLGFSIRRAADGAEGLAALGDRIPVAILLDLNMPNLNGFEFIEQLAQSKDFATIPLIVLSGQELSVAQHHHLLASGCRYYMKGSAAPREIAATLREMVA